MARLSRRAALVAAFALAAGAALADAPASQPGDMSLGDAKAKVQVVEYASASCPHCARWDTEVFPAFKKKYVDTGRVRYTLRELLTPPETVAAAGFLMARCAGPSKYFKVLDEVFRSQARWTEGASIKPIFVEIAKTNGLDEKQLDACLSDKAALDALNGRVGQAVAAGVNSTPTFFVNGKQIGEGEVTLAQLDAAIAAARK